MSLIETLQIARTPILTVIAGFFSLAGNEIVFLCTLGLIFWCMNKNVAYRVGFAYILAGPVFFMVRGSAHVPRPWIRKATLSPVQFAALGAEGYSMPSAHTLNAAALGARFVTNSRMLIAKASAVMFVILTAFSRIYLGLVIAGFIDQSFVDFSVRCDYSWQQILKALIGVFIILAVRGGISMLLNLLFPHFLFGNFFCNLMSVLLAFGLYPMLISRYFAARYR